MTLGRVIKHFYELHSEAVSNRYIKKPISWALYQTWKWADEKEKPRGQKEVDE